jgi:hypothetical protein
MGILLAFAPFIVFAVLDRIVGPVGALTAGATVSAALLARDLIGSGRSMKILEAGTFILFSGLAVYTALSGVNWSVIGVRLCVDAGLLAIVLASMAARAGLASVVEPAGIHPDKLRDNRRLGARVLGDGAC